MLKNKFLANQQQVVDRLVWENAKKRAADEVAAEEIFKSILTELEALAESGTVLPTVLKTQISIPFWHNYLSSSQQFFRFKEALLEKEGIKIAVRRNFNNISFQAHLDG